MYWLTGITGAILMITPFLFGFTNNTVALSAGLLTELIVVGASIWEGLESRAARWEYWVVTIIGVFTILAPFLLGFENHSGALWTNIIVGSVITILAGSQLWSSSISFS